MKDEFSLPAFFVGMLVGGFITIILSVTAMPAQKNLIIEGACGTCQELGKICGEFVCSKDGWK